MIDEKRTDQHTDRKTKTDIVIKLGNQTDRGKEGQRQTEIKVKRQTGGREDRE